MHSLFFHRLSRDRINVRVDGVVTVVYTCLWLRNRDARKIIYETSTSFRDVDLAQNGEDQLNSTCVK